MSKGTSATSGAIGVISGAIVTTCTPIGTATDSTAADGRPRRNIPARLAIESQGGQRRVSRTICVGKIAQAPPSRFNIAGDFVHPTHCVGGGRSGHSLAIEFRVVPEDALLVKGDAAVGGEVGGDTRTLGYPIVQRDDAGMALFQLRHCAWVGVTKAGNDLEQR